MKVPVTTLREAIIYNRATGEMHWAERPIWHFNNDDRWTAAQSQKRWNTRYAGKEVGTLLKSGYIGVRVDGAHALAHRVAWAVATGTWPTQSIDHINNNRADNRLANLRLATRSEQSRNCRPNKNGTSGYLGVSYRKERDNWRAVIFAEGKQKYLGSFSSEVEAARAYDQAAQKYFGDFANLNFAD